MKDLLLDLYSREILQESLASVAIHYCRDGDLRFKLSVFRNSVRCQMSWVDRGSIVFHKDCMHIINKLIGNVRAYDNAPVGSKYRKRKMKKILNTVALRAY